MNRLLILLFSIFLIGCCNEPKLLNNGLTQKATQITEYTIKVKNDSLNNQIQDTLVITEKKYNENDQIISRHQRNLFADETMDIEFIYNNQKKIKREIVTLSNDSSNFIVDYFYKDTLLLETKSESKNDIFQFKQIGGYKYNSDNKLKESSLKQIYIDVETNDTITNTLEVSKYNDREFVIESKLSDFRKPERNRKTEYKYDCGILMEIKEFNSKDSLISTTEYKYEFDKFENWTKRKSIENDKLNYIRTREIEYK
ncbi:hypothetical protein [Mesoflavibacter zeaxanthinifaciens]|uniref:hypothetical protein n=1 Tax=Mesoflavibacter zeaxanthinifaciens TaxID=393060 RepID=UPI000418831D|nr:hypothetical protein [Mesoflavibacter zeaxanthinifaciens]MCP4054836.1 hypothetical protein [Mesoflavibacter sp.]